MLRWRFRVERTSQWHLRNPGPGPSKATYSTLPLDKEGNSEVLLNLLFKTQNVSAPQNHRLFFLGAEGSHLRKKEYTLQNFFGGKKRWWNHLRCQDFSAVPQSVSQLLNNGGSGVSGIRVHPRLPHLWEALHEAWNSPSARSARGLLSPTPTCLYLLYSGYQRYRPQRAKRSDKRFPPSWWVPWLPLPLWLALLLHRFKAWFGPKLKLLFSPLSGDGWENQPVVREPSWGGSSSARPRLGSWPGGRRDPAPHRPAARARAPPRAGPR